MDSVLEKCSRPATTVPTSRALHPFDPITPNEIRRATATLRRHFPGVQLRFKVIDLQEPRKAEVLAFLEAERLKESSGPRPTRRIHALFHRKFLLPTPMAQTITENYQGPIMELFSKLWLISQRRKSLS